MEDRIERDVLIEAPVERVWTLITEAEHLGTWFADDGADVDLREGGAIEMRWQEHGAVRCRIESIDEPNAFSFRWAPFKDPGGAEPAAGNSTLVEFKLAEEGGATRLSVAESGFASLDTTPEQRIANLRGNVEGWELELGELASHAAKVAA
jgi:uncharacterized protein YndB with AHSA1/START domain